MINIKFLIILITVLINEICSNKTKDLKYLQQCKEKYIVVVDGGSSGTRLNYFEFIQIEDLLVMNIADKMSSKIALSKFSKAREDWGLMRIMFHNLTSFATSKIPAPCLIKTPIYIQVTAGVRQLEQAMSKKILSHIRSIFLKSKFKFKPEFVDILSIEQEGRLAWVSVNFLLGKLQRNTCKDTVGMLDLGGGSTQISFATNNASLIGQTKKIVIFGQQYQLYTAGYDYLGMDETRLKYFKAAHCIGSKCENQTMRSNCMHPKVIAKLQFGNRTVKIGGSMTTSQSRFFQCALEGVNLATHVKHINYIVDKIEFVAVSAFYYIIKSAFKISKEKEKDLNKFSSSEIMSRAIEICASPENNIKSYKHLQCLDMSYIVALLFSSYRFGWHQKIAFSNRIKKVGLSWALGYAVATL